MFPGSTPFKSATLLTQPVPPLLLPRQLAVPMLMVLLGTLLALLPRPLRADPSGSSLAELSRLQRQALRQNGLDRQRLRELAVRLRLSALLPQLRATWGRGTQWAYSTRTDTLSELLPDGDRSSYSVSLAWDLSRLLFAPPELILGREATRLSSQRTQLLLRVAEAYLQRCQAGPTTGGSPSSTGPRPGQSMALDILLSALLGDEARPLRLTHCPREAIDPATLTGALSRPADPPEGRPAEEVSLPESEER